ncbi:MAG: S-methyl-5-thioribose-1-phosphate isomerase [Alphaproteobacteria bacterium]|nr:S-methyl-5-thioribose-1-phosphate isomerase [Alphaproteobacteria bacterium]
MQPLASLSIRFDGQRVSLLDQQALPDAERWVDATEPADMIAAIQALKVRGAPAIGVAAALCLARQAELGRPPERLRELAAALRAARPTAVNLMWAMDRLVALLDREDPVAAVVAETEQLFAEDVTLCARMARLGAALIQPGERLLTHCNTGALATAGVGTALGVIAEAHAQGKGVEVWVDETRPLLQGGRLTAWELGRLGVPYRLITDSMAAALMARGLVDRVLVGADRVAANGDFANKIGTYGLAVAAGHHGLPFHVVAPWTTVDLSCPDGAHIPIEERRPEEVRGAAGSFGAVRWAPADAPVANPAFDVTPVSLVTSLVLDQGVYSRAQLEAGALRGMQVREV